MNMISITKLYDLLIPKLGKEETEGLISFLENKNSDGMEKPHSGSCEIGDNIKNEK